MAVRAHLTYLCPHAGTFSPCSGGCGEREDPRRVEQARQLVGPPFLASGPEHLGS